MTARNRVIIGVSSVITASALGILLVYPARVQPSFSGPAIQQLGPGYAKLRAQGIDVRSIYSFYRGRAIFSTNGGKWGLVDNEFRVIVPPIYGQMGHPDSDAITVRVDGAEGLIDRNGNILVPIKPEFRTATYREGLYVIEANNLHWGVVSGEGEWMLPANYDTPQQAIQEFRKLQKQNARGGLSPGEPKGEDNGEDNGRGPNTPVTPGGD